MTTASERQMMIDTIRQFPEVLAAAVQGLTVEQLHKKPLADEWTIQQIVHHMADSHLNSFIRLKGIITADKPTLVGYDQEAWAKLPDVELPIEHSLMILRGLHARWCTIWESLTDEQWQRVGIHTENGPVTPADMLATYYNHCVGHLDQVKRVKAAL